MVAANTAMTTDSYTPVLKCKQGEVGAIAGLSAADRSRLLPMIEVRDGAKPIPGLASAWGDVTNVLLIHALNVDGYDDVDWEAMVDDLFNALQAEDVPYVPVATTDDSATIVARIASACVTNGRGAAIRLDGEATVLAPPPALAMEISALLAGLGLNEEECDLIVDVGLVRDSLVARITTAEAALHSVPNIHAWRNVVVAFSAFPESVGDSVPAGAVVPLPRDDALAFAALMGRSPEREPNYGDYAVGTPFYVDIPWAPIPSLRYAADEYWYIHRGATKANRSAQYVSLCTGLVAASHFVGPGASVGDNYFNDVAAGHDGPGNPMTYVRAATSRHLACVLDRLASLGVP